MLGHDERATFGDVNNDGYIDIVLGNGSPKMDRLDPHGPDGERWRDSSATPRSRPGLPYRGKSHGVNMADLFGDGRMSILVASGGAVSRRSADHERLLSERLPGNYVNIRLVGVMSNRSAIGAKISVQAGGRWQYREVSGGSNFGCLPLEQHFGLAANSKR